MKKTILWFFMLWYSIIAYLIHEIFHLSWNLFFRDVENLFHDSTNHYEVILAGVSIAVWGMMIAIWLFQKRYDIKIIIGGGDKKYSIINFIRRHSFICLTIMAGIFIYCCIRFPYIEPNDDKEWEMYTTIAHAGGILDEYKYSNCEAAILSNYEKGHRVFEIDLLLTSDDKIVGKHKWEESFQEGLVAGNVPTENEFLSIPLWGKYEPLSFERLCELMDNHEDMWIVTDTKSGGEEYNKKFFGIMVEKTRELGMEHILNRVIVQLYDENMQREVNIVYPFESYILTLYLTGFGGDTKQFLQYVRYCYVNGIDAITMGGHLLTPNLTEIANRYGIEVYVHTLNDMDAVNRALTYGVNGIYTDSLTPDMVGGK